MHTTDGEILLCQIIIIGQPIDLSVCVVKDDNLHDGDDFIWISEGFCNGDVEFFDFPKGWFRYE